MDETPSLLLFKNLREYSKLFREENTKKEKLEEEDCGLNIQYEFEDFFDFEDPFNQHLNDFDDIVFCNFALNYILEAWRHNTWTQVTLEGICLKFGITKEKEDLYDMISAIFTCLERAGHINFGLFKITRPLTPQKKTILVLGAGISGIVAARQLKFFGFDVKILEASSRIGGRLHSFCQDGHFFDLGCSFISHIKENPILTVLKQLRLIIGNQNPKLNLTFLSSNIKLYLDGIVVDKKKELSIQNLFLNILTYCYKLITKLRITQVEHQNISLEELFQALLSVFELTVCEEIIDMLEKMHRLGETSYCQLQDLKKMYKVLVPSLKTYLNEEEVPPESENETEGEEDRKSGKVNVRISENEIAKVPPEPDLETKQKLEFDDVDLTKLGIDEDKIMEIDFSTIYDNHIKFNASVAKEEEYTETCEKLINAENKGLHNAEAALSIDEERILEWNFACLEYLIGAPISEVSSKYFFLQSKLQQCSKQVYTPCSYLEILSQLSNEIDIQTNAKVTHIKLNEDCVEVEVELEDGIEEISCDAVLCTVPLGVLKKTVEKGEFSNKITFEPPLPNNKLFTIDQKLGVGTVNRVEMYFDSIFWEAEDTMFGNVGLTRESRGELFLVMSLFNAPVLSIFSCGVAIKVMEKLSDDYIVSRCMNVLKEIFDDKPNNKRFTVPKPVAVSVSHWDRNEFFMGSHSYPKINSTQDDYDIMAEPVYLINKNGVPSCSNQPLKEYRPPKIFFAGEHTHRDHPATVHGAFLSGLREAGNIANHFFEYFVE